MPSGVSLGELGASCAMSTRACERRRLGGGDLGVSIERIDDNS